jgi:hypothetical protein
MLSSLAGAIGSIMTSRIEPVLHTSDRWRRAIHLR